jgi:uncharacterized protein (DUF305 family)
VVPLAWSCGHLEQEVVRAQSEKIQQMAQWYRSWYPAGAQR